MSSRARRSVARIVTQPTDFFGTVFSRMLDPWGNMWWVYQHGEAPDLDWDAAESDTDSDPTEWSDPNLEYIHRTLIETMPSLGTEPEEGESRGDPNLLIVKPS